MLRAGLVELSVSIFEFLDFSSFLSVWYWVLVLITWALIGHFTMGVPFDAVMRAERKGGEFAEDCDALAQVQARRIARFMRVGGVVVAGLVAFALAVLATLGFWRGVEFARALFMLAAPVAFVLAKGAGLAMQVSEGGLTGAELRQRIVRRRYWDQVIGILTITVIAGISGLSAASEGFRRETGAGLGDVLKTLLAEMLPAL